MNAPQLLDSNVLVHASKEGSPFQREASALVERGLRESGLYCIAPQNLVEFCAVVTRPRFVDPPLTPAEAAEKASILYRSRRLAKIYPRRGTVARALRDAAELGISGQAWYDLFLAETMRDAGVHVIVTDDARDLEKIPFVTVRRLRDGR